jgi:hypothetical protein
LWQGQTSPSDGPKDSRTNVSRYKRYLGKASKKVFLTLKLGRRPIKIWVSVANITNEFILGLDKLRAYDASVDLGRQTHFW